MQLQVGDRFTDEEGEWELSHTPFTTREGKLVHATVQKPGEPASAKEKTWPAHERLMVRRAGETSVGRTGRRQRSRRK